MWKHSIRLSDWLSILLQIVRIVVLRRQRIFYDSRDRTGEGAGGGPLALLSVKLSPLGILPQTGPSIFFKNVPIPDNKTLKIHDICNISDAYRFVFSFPHLRTRSALPVTFLANSDRWNLMLVACVVLTSCVYLGLGRVSFGLWRGLGLISSVFRSQWLVCEHVEIYRRSFQNNQK